MTQHVHILASCLYVTVEWIKIVKMWNSLPAAVEDYSTIQILFAVLELLGMQLY